MVHINRTVARCFATLQQMHCVHYSLSHDRLQSVLNKGARLACSANRRDHASLLLRELHWLRVPERIENKLCVLAYRCLNGLSQEYITRHLNLVTDVPTRPDFDPRRLWTSLYWQQDDRPLAIMLSQWQLLGHRTPRCLSTSKLPPLFQFSDSY